ncbi:MAG: hypothetical protein LBQ12_11645, partial [Deltaproteobacteria bacterium]|nr:hypothetical protein [Deltaproteobacteria bacterium]
MRWRTGQGAAGRAGPPSGREIVGRWRPAVMEAGMPPGPGLPEGLEVWAVGEAGCRVGREAGEA